MKNYTFADTFRALYDKAVALYAAGQTDPETYFNAEEKSFLQANGITTQNLYDYAEDHNGYGEPGYDRTLQIETVRRDYFLNAQNGKPSATTIDPATMPLKTEAVQGIDWLPRLIVKTKAKLRGELPSSLMFSCSGDRAFFKKHDINPAEFMSVVWRNENNDAAIVDWVVSKSAAKK
jgi:hypothetical protein